MAQQTAVEWLFKHIEGIKIIDGYEFIKLQEAFEQAKQMEKEQIIKAFNEGTFVEIEKINSEEYYNEIYNNQV
jgi:hypothetical protein